MKKIINSSLSILFALVICLNIVGLNTSALENPSINNIELDNDQPEIETKK